MKNPLMRVVPARQQEIEQIHRCSSAILRDDRVDAMPYFNKTFGRENGIASQTTDLDRPNCSAVSRSEGSV